MRNPRSTTILVVSPGCSATQQTKQVDRRIVLSLFPLTNKLEACVTWNAYPELMLISVIQPVSVTLQGFLVRA
jgi:hypothetical protein